VAIRTQVCELLGIEHPLVLGGMMGISDGRLTAAVSEAGGLGTLSTATFGVDGTRREIETIRSITDKPFSLNLPIFHPMVPDLVEVVKELGVEIVTSSAGSPDKYTRDLKEAGVIVLHVVSTLRTAQKAAAAGVDILVAEGIESGGKVSREEVPTISLIPQVADVVDIPIIGAGGLADGRGLLAVLALGAQGAQFGTRFLATKESPAHDNWKNALVGIGDAGTAVACRLSSPTRMIRNEFFAEMDALDGPDATQADIIDAMMKAVVHIPKDVEGQLGAYPAGTGSGLIHSVETAGDVVREIMADAEQGLSRLSAVG
jgi:enoyl-[acyl-carrier protein] reductase II